ncbi:Glycosyl hydrolase family 32 domain protein [Parafrankia sp. EAN1pec]|uniref:glycoside hydrolase family 32 protein n=1 Tax=Parafrankia sp. (strain EAN1pec) TaxID=298653 RepID=UPI00005418A5|nr:Glycosyl hydrolase family 32 domain protein [Frankia sp. EAN1pec]
MSILVRLMRSSLTRVRFTAVTVALAAVFTSLLPAVPALAGQVSDYPEFPYPTTDYTEPLRGQFHFSSRGGWMNDINAPLYHNGLYHVFYQHNPHSLLWETMHWGHATSPDLVHWTQKPIALEPGVHPHDLWSGAGVVDTNNTSGLQTGSEAPILVFTATNGVSINYSNDAAKTFQIYNQGQKVVTPAGISRDPKVFWHAPSNRWVMVVWSDAGGNGVNIYTSPNLLTWTFRSRYAADWLYECPDLFSLAVDGDPGNTRWVMTDAGGEYVIGSFDGVTFTPEWTSPQRMDQGHNTFEGTFYAGLTFNHMPDNRIVQMAWMRSNQGSVWTGNASFPAELGLRAYPEGIRLTRNPVGEIASLRVDSQSWVNRDITPDPASDPLTSTFADTYEIIAEFDTATATASRFGFRLHTRSDGTFDRAVTYDRTAQTLYGAPLAPINGRVRMRLLVDRGQLEIFGNDGKLSWTDNVNFNSAPSSQGVQLYAEGGNVQLVSLQFHRLQSAWGSGESTLESNLAGPWHPAGGTWVDTTTGKQGTAGGDGFYLSNQTGADFTYEGDLRLDTAVAAGITFRANSDATQQYTANVDANGLVKLWRPGRDIGIFYTPISQGRTYHLKVVTSGSIIRVYLDHRPTPVIDAVDTAYTSGYFGTNVFGGTGVVQNANVNATGFVSNLGATWRPATGLWTVPGAGVKGRVAGDGFYLSDQTGTNFTYEGDVKVINGVAAALTFRSNADATGHYTANVDTNGLVKLWRPGSVIGVFNTPIVEGRTYHLKVVANGPNIRVYFDGGATPVIDAVDSTYSSGFFGVNVFSGVGVIQNVVTS